MLSSPKPSTSQRRIEKPIPSATPPGREPPPHFAKKCNQRWNQRRYLRTESSLAAGAKTLRQLQERSDNLALDDHSRLPSTPDLVAGP